MTSLSLVLALAALMLGLLNALLVTSLARDVETLKRIVAILCDQHLCDRHNADDDEEPW